MPGPMSAPNGDKSLTVADKFFCQRHGLNVDKCVTAQNKDESTCSYISKREYLRRTNRLTTGKTRR